MDSFGWLSQKGELQRIIRLKIYMVGIAKQIILLVHIQNTYVCIFSFKHISFDVHTVKCLRSSFVTKEVEKVGRYEDVTFEGFVVVTNQLTPGP